MEKEKGAQFKGKFILKKTYKSLINGIGGGA